MTSTAPPASARHGDEKVLTIIEHLQELRTRVIWCAGALVVVMSPNRR